MAIDPRELFKSALKSEETVIALGGTRAERIQRFQVGGFGLAAMVLMVALADIVITRARDTEARSVPEVAARVARGEAATPRDPLADAGVLPVLPEDRAGDGVPAAPQETGDVRAPLRP